MGAAVGALVQIIVIMNYHRYLMFLPMSARLWLDTSSFYACPLWALGFSNLVHTESELYAVVLIGNLIIYGLIGMLCNLFFRGLGKIIRRHEPA